MKKNLIMTLTGIYLVLTLYQTVTGFIVQEPIQNASLHEMYHALKLEIATLSVKSANLLKDYNTIKLENENFRVEVADLKRKAAGVEIELANATGENMKLQNDLQKVSTEFSAMEKDLENLNSSNQVLNQQYSDLSSQYFKLKEKFDNQSKDVNSNTGVQPSREPRVGFSVSWPQRAPYGQIHEGPLKFLNSFYDEDSVYNTTTGEFTCKTSGLYFFSSMIIRQVGQETASSCYIMVNNKALAYLEGYSFNASYGSPSGTGTALYHMQAGDTASIDNCTNVNQIAGYSNFNGFLLDAD